MAKVGRPKKEKTKVLYIRIPERTAHTLKEKAKRDHRGISATIELIVKEYLQMGK